MNPMIKAEWITALRSGDYKQSRFALKQGDEFCCLGVLCDIVKSKVNGSWIGLIHSDRDAFCINGHAGPVSTLPLEVRNLTGLMGLEENTLVGKNDAGETFERIADYIEKEI